MLALLALLTTAHAAPAVRGAAARAQQAADDDTSAAPVWAAAAVAPNPQCRCAARGNARAEGAGGGAGARGRVRGLHAARGARTPCGLTPRCRGARAPSHRVRGNARAPRAPAPPNPLSSPRQQHPPPDARHNAARQRCGRARPLRVVRRKPARRRHPHRAPRRLRRPRAGRVRRLRGLRRVRPHVHFRGAARRGEQRRRDGRGVPRPRRDRRRDGGLPALGGRHVLAVPAGRGAALQPHVLGGRKVAELHGGAAQRHGALEFGVRSFRLPAAAVLAARRERLLDGDGLLRAGLPEPRWRRDGRVLVRGHAGRKRAHPRRLRQRRRVLQPRRLAHVVGRAQRNQLPLPLDGGRRDARECFRRLCRNVSNRDLGNSERLHGQFCEPQPPDGLFPIRDAADGEPDGDP